MRRGTGQGDLIWDRMAKDEEWRFFLESLWRLQYTREVCRLEQDPPLVDVIYEETQGISDLAVKAYMFAQERAISSGRERITASIIRSAVRDKLGLPRAVLDALRTNDRRVLEQYEDVYPPQLKHCLPQLLSAPEAVCGIANDISHTSHADAPPAVSSDEQENARHQSLDRMPGRPPNEACGELPKIVAGLSGQNDLAAYNALLQAGYIRRPEEYLPEVYGRKEE
jgi:hypothetical protein